MLIKMLYCLLLLAVAVGPLAGCGKKLGSHSLRLRLQVAVDSATLTVVNPSKATYYRTEVDVNDAFRWELGTLRPQTRRIIRLDSLRDGAGKHWSPRVRVDAIWCYAQDSAGNFDAFTQPPTPNRP
ncbi:hypothetical protein MON38_20335 [Hymenobacter sp. DH14]|uniref:Uncharacterized protein n=1 Tax=Hymenobacter cyanobacteriorum TaxID=2926463 RepID=A0A9X1VJG2_9BACT|nr:hypothetical protein [Hymenobacter cyanobacteriorum]MCI1189778.1 hypothetical protein [Hymenobacter cyanobacteriorum]